MCSHCGKAGTVRALHDTQIIVQRKKNHDTGEERVVMTTGIRRSSLPEHRRIRGRKPRRYKRAVVCHPNRGCGRVLEAEVARG